MREEDLSAPVSAWLEAQGFTVYCEVPWLFSVVDIVGERGGEQVAVELKCSLTKKVLRQASSKQLATNKVYVAVGTNPRPAGIEKCRGIGLGLLSVRDGKVSVLVEPRGMKGGPMRTSRYRFALAGHTPGGVAGRPNVKGEGPAQDVERRIAEYRKEHPNVTWKELYANVQNHYTSAKSMCGAMKMLRERRYFQEQRKKRTKARVIARIPEEGLR